MELLLVYLWLKINTIITVCILAAIGFTAARFIYAGMRSECRGIGELEEFDNKYGKSRSWLVPTAIICGMLAFLLPTKTDIAILVGSSVVIDVAKSPEGAKIGKLLRGKANELLDEELKNLETK